MDTSNRGSKEREITQDVFDQLIHYLKYASSAYTPICPRPNGNNLITHFSGISEGHIARDDSRKELIVALRGSANITDMLLDTQIVLVPYLSPGVSVPHEVRVHAGFLTAWDSVSVQVLAVLAAQLAVHTDIKRIVTTGHSLGGSLATLSAISLMQHFPHCKILTYSYGAPRTGNNAFAKFVNEKFGNNAFRVVHTHDGVPTMICQSLGYHHHGIEYWQAYEPAIPENITRCEAENGEEDPTCSLSIPSSGINDAHFVYFGIVATTPFCL
ncbi:alpha/beta-hydrolase [Rhodocollybia butyracea]|uniref:Alpha/beta-hydrolase n=1 Tax=Rhodocollybia butyracea TaxID=206335 RepID=A0A9P5PZU3_9AGAR|nr:alpha/beta-hydrolase [Rhodocollybia butyracea]